MNIILEHNAYLTSFSIEDYKFSGALYDSAGDLITSSCRSNNNVLYEHVNPSTVPDVEFKQVSGCSLFLGHYHFHFGHFLLETVSQLYFYKYFSSHIDNIIFLPFTENPNRRKIDASSSGFQQACLKGLNIDQKKILICSENLVFDEIIIPERMFEINNTYNPVISEVYRKIKNKYSTKSKFKIFSSKINHKRIFLSRVNFDRKGGKGRVSQRKSREIENIFRNNGYTVISPEEISFQKQINLVSNAEYIAGIEGSALHLSLFMNKGSTCISINSSDSRENPNIKLCNDVQQINTIQLPIDSDYIQYWLNDLI